jgi:hypothetical protein
MSGAKDGDSDEKQGQPRAGPRGGIEEIVRFIEGHVSSLEELEVMLLLRSTAPRAWCVEEVVRELGSSVRSIQIRLDKLAHMQIVDVFNDNEKIFYKYNPIDEHGGALIDGVARLYKERRLFVIDLLYGRPESDVRALSEAFRIRKGRGGA